MTRLATAFLPGFAAGGPWRRGLGMRMLRTGRKRRILRRLAEPRFQFLDARFELGDPLILLGNPSQQQTNDRLCLRRLPGNGVFRDQWLPRHAGDVADFLGCAKAISAIQSLRVVNGYVLGGEKMEENLFYMASKGIIAWCRRDYEYSDCNWLVLAGSEVVPSYREGWMYEATQEWRAILRAKEFLVELRSGLWMFAKDWLCTSRTIACDVCGGYHEKRAKNLAS